MGHCKRSPDVREYEDVVRNLSPEQPATVTDMHGTWWPVRGIWVKGAMGVEVNFLACGFGCKCRKSGKQIGQFHRTARTRNPLGDWVMHTSEEVYATPTAAYESADGPLLGHAIAEAAAAVDTMMASITGADALAMATAA